MSDERQEITQNILFNLFLKISLETQLALIIHNYGKYLNEFILFNFQCSPHSWYLSQDSFNFLIGLILLWIFKRHQKLMFPILGALLVFCMGKVFVEYYVGDYDSLIFVNPE